MKDMGRKHSTWKHKVKGFNVMDWPCSKYSNETSQSHKVKLFSFYISFYFVIVYSISFPEYTILTRVG